MVFVPHRHRLVISISSIFDVSFVLFLPKDSSAKDGIVGDLLPVWSRWYEIGVALKMATFDLDQIALQKKDLQNQIKVGYIM